MKKIQASIVTIGDELLIGQVIDTNSAWIARQLNSAGVIVLRRVSVGDGAEAIERILDEESKEVDLILMTGGLGPTSDDITKKVLCRYFQGKMVVNEAALENVKYLFNEVFHRPVTPINLLQAEVPDVCEVIQNPRGTAPGMIFYKGEKMFVSMPGVPFEMEGMITGTVIPLVKKKWNLPLILHRTLVTAGIGESALAEMITDFEQSLPSSIRLAYLPSYGYVRLRLSAAGTDPESMTVEMDRIFGDLKRQVKEYLVTDQDEPMEVVIGKLLSKRNQTISTAESCTGGYIAHLITTVPGASTYYEGSVISYSYNIKEKLLGVKGVTLLQHGAVSEETVIEMLKGVIEKVHTDFGIAVSGIMGPGGATEDKPVGTVWMAVGNQKDFLTQKLQLRFNRKRNIEVTSTMALNLLRKFILTH